MPDLLKVKALNNKKKKCEDHTIHQNIFDEYSSIPSIF